MIILNKIKKEDYEEIDFILEREGLERGLDEQIVYTLKDDEIIMGVGEIDLNFNWGILNYVIIKEEHRGADLGDALLRILLFKAESLGIKGVFYPYENSYLIKKGFTHNKTGHMDTYNLYISISNFFNRGCCGDKNEL